VAYYAPHDCIRVPKPPVWTQFVRYMVSGAPRAEKEGAERTGGRMERREIAKVDFIFHNWCTI
jgi:hypothetical protein